MDGSWQHSEGTLFSNAETVNFTLRQRRRESYDIMFTLGDQSVKVFATTDAFTAKNVPLLTTQYNKTTGEWAVFQSNDLTHEIGTISRIDGVCSYENDTMAVELNGGTVFVGVGEGREKIYQATAGEQAVFEKLSRNPLLTVQMMSEKRGNEKELKQEIQDVAFLLPFIAREQWKAAV